MPEYRLYPLDRHNRVAGPPTVVDAVDDADARERAGAMLDRHPGVEVWNDARKVETLSRGPAEAAATAL
jgi:hypothetical protein